MGGGERASRQGSTRMVPAYVAYDALVQRARNDLVQLAVDNGFDDLIFIDADQQWNPQWVAQLLSYPVDVVGAPVRRKSDPECYNVRALRSPVPVDPVTGLFIVDGIGAGFLRMSRRAFTALWGASVPYTTDERHGRMVFDVQIIDGQLLSEDHVLCRKLQALGFAIHVDGDMTCSHIGSKKWDGDFRRWLRNTRASPG